MEQSSLFDLSRVSTEIQKAADTTKSKSVKTQENVNTALGMSTQKIQEVIGNVKMGETTHYASLGEWSMHDLLFHLLTQTGPAQVYISTWSVSEDAVRQLLAKLQDGSITTLKSVFDWRVKMRRPEAYELAKYNIADIRLTTCHAKVTVIENDSWSIAIVGSANYTNNPRIEAGVISCDKKAAAFHKSWMLEELQHSDPFDTKKKRKCQ